MASLSSQLGRVVQVGRRLVSRARARREGLRQGVAIGPGVQFGPRVRCAALDGAKIEIGARTEIGAGTSLSATGPGARLVLGPDVFISGGCILAAAELIEIGAESMVAELVSIRDHDHDPSAPPRSGAKLVSPLHVGKRVWIGAKASIVRGGWIEDDVVVGAHALVNRPAPAGSLVAGVPARVVKERIRQA